MKLTAAAVLCLKVSHVSREAKLCNGGAVWKEHSYRKRTYNRGQGTGPKLHPSIQPIPAGIGQLHRTSISLVTTYRISRTSTGTIRTTMTFSITSRTTYRNNKQFRTTWGVSRTYSQCYHIYSRSAYLFFLELSTAILLKIISIEVQVSKIQVNDIQDMSCRYSSRVS